MHKENGKLNMINLINFAKEMIDLRTIDKEY